MNKDRQHIIDQLIREKFENYTPQPPDFVWENIEAELDGAIKGGFFKQYKTLIYAAVTAAVILIVGWLLSGKKDFPHMRNDSSVKLEMQSPSDIPGNNEEVVANRSETGNPVKANDKTVAVSGLNTEKGQSIFRNTDYSGLGDNEKPFQNKPASNAMRNNTANPNGNFALQGFDYSATKTSDGGVALYENQRNNSPVPSLRALLLSDKQLFDLSHDASLSRGTPSATEKPAGRNGASWYAGLSVTPEFALSVPDSLTVLHGYTIGLDFQRNFSGGLFLRMSAGASYQRDRGFTNMTFNRWDYLGSYDDVYDVTFDTSGGTPVPIYHTNRVDVYDSITHFDVRETVRKYVYLQLPLLAGYRGTSTGRLQWFVTAGPALNVLLGQSLDLPQPDAKSRVVKYESNLAERNRIVWQLWLGGGVEYALSERLRFSLEPHYRYYFNPVYKNYYQKQAISAIGIRMAVTVNLK